jgi:hypothetical protein
MKKQESKEMKERESTLIEKSYIPKNLNSSDFRSFPGL